jgi:hypothetical protein
MTPSPLPTGYHPIWAGTGVNFNDPGRAGGVGWVDFGARQRASKRKERASRQTQIAVTAAIW